MIWRLNSHQSTSLAEARKDLEAHGWQPWVASHELLSHGWVAMAGWLGCQGMAGWVAMAGWLGCHGWVASHELLMAGNPGLPAISGFVI